MSFFKVGFLFPHYTAACGGQLFAIGDNLVATISAHLILSSKVKTVHLVITHIF